MGRNIPIEIQNKILKLYKEIGNQTEVAKLTNVSQGYVRLLLIRNKIDINTQGDVLSGSHWKYKEKWQQEIIDRTGRRQLVVKIHYIKDLGGKCVKCNELEIKFLTFDHIHNDGKEDRESFIWGDHIPQWYFNQHRDKFQVMCYNCNWIKFIETKDAPTSIQHITWRSNTRNDIIYHYSNGLNKCLCCGISDVRVLCLDHINGGGSQERIDIGAYQIYSRLIRENYPSGYQILCRNCNCAKAYYGICPHKEVNNVIV